MRQIVAVLWLASVGMASASAWDDPLDAAGITSQAVAMKRQPILRVLHEEGPGGWQFYDDVEPLEGPIVLPKHEILRLDPSLAAIKDLPVGWEAIRKSAKSPWVRTKATP